MSEEPGDINENSEALDSSQENGETIESVETNQNFSFVAYNEDVCHCVARRGAGNPTLLTHYSNHFMGSMFGFGI